MSKMKYKQISLEEALERYNSGKDTNILVPGPDWEDYQPSTMNVFLKNILCFVDSDEKTDVSDQTDIAPPPNDLKPEKKSRGKKLDDGKIMALYRAGWNIAKIADEMKVSSPTIRSRIKQMEGTESNEQSGEKASAEESGEERSCL